MKENKLFNTPLIPVLLMFTGLIQLTHDLALSVISGICPYIPAYFIDQVFTKRR